MNGGWPTLEISTCVARALEEDSAREDITAQFFLPKEARFAGKIVAKQKCVVAGVKVAVEVFRQVEPAIKVENLVADGQKILPGQAILAVEGAAMDVLAAERVALNFLQHLSGIATLTARFVEAVQGTGVEICDTRKTTPGLRALEKAAVVAGGGKNHRLSLADMVIVKDNHLALLRALTSSDWEKQLAERIRAVRQQRQGIRVAVEADCVDLAKTLFAMEGIDLVMLDNLTLDELRECVRLRPAGVILESTGGVTLANVRAIAETGVDRISIGCITHSAPAVDLSLEAE